MAVSTIRIHSQNIASHFQAQPFGGTHLGARGSLARGDAIRIAERMALQARINAAERFNQRTTSLVTSVVPIVRQGRGGQTEVGVGTTVEHGWWLENGADAHDYPIWPQVRFRGRGKGGYLLRSDGPNSKGPNPDPLDRPQPVVIHPGVQARHWMSDAVRSVVPGAFVRVRRLR